MAWMEPMLRRIAPSTLTQETVLLAEFLDPSAPRTQLLLHIQGRDSGINIPSLRTRPRRRPNRCNPTAAEPLTPVSTASAALAN